MIKYHLPNLLTLSRIFGTLFWLPVYWQGWSVAAFFLAATLILTDLLDGMLARSLNRCSVIGSKLDPVADKFLIITMLTSIFLNGQLEWYYLLVIVLRDICQLSSFPLLVFLKISFKVAPNIIPKIASGLNYAVILLILGNIVFFDRLYILNLATDIVIWISLLLEGYILIDYFKQITNIIKGNSDTFY